jgi:hypothetical protein
MKRTTRFWFAPFLAGILVAALTLAGCSGDDGAPGPAGPPGQDVDPATVDNLQSQIDDINTLLAAAQDVSPESCLVCHSDEGGIVISGAGHQEEYNKYTDASLLALTIDTAASVSNGDGTFTATMTFTAAKDGAPLTAEEIAALPQRTFYASAYDSGTEEFTANFSFAGGTTAANYSSTGTPGQFTVTQATAPFEIGDGTNTQVYAYITDDELETEQPAGSHVHLYDNVANAGLTFGDANTYASAANVSACEGCHGSPYMKHGYRAAVVTNGVNPGLSDFGGCKNCHYDTRDGGHEDWQILKDDPARYAEIAAGDPLTPEEEAKYAYKAKLMNDVHMSHNMEFPYPQGNLFNCATCHEGKLDEVLSDEHYQAETCISCHSVDGLIAKMTTARDGHTIVVHDSFINTPENLKSTDCSAACHSAGGVVPAIVFSSIHNGYNPRIYAYDAATATATKYADEVTVSIDNTSVANNVLTINFSADAGTLAGSVDVSTIVPTVMIGLYGYNTKDYIVAAHGRDADNNRLLEYPVDGVTVNPRFTTVTAAGGAWEVTADLSLWADMITDGVIKRAEIAVRPRIDNADGDSIGLNAPSRTFDLGANAFDDGYYSDIVKVADGCNNCHDQLATTFHSGDRGGNIRVCRLCHVKSSGGSHLEMQSRSIDSYVHAIHSFQAFDPERIDFNDPVEALEYEHHINHTYPNFTIKNCESCHNPDTYGVPDQSKSLPAILSASDTNDTWDRNIGAVPSVVTGPAATACGACHRTHMINEDNASELAAFNSHTEQFGYRVEETDGVWDKVVDTIMSMF